MVATATGVWRSVVYADGVLFVTNHLGKQRRRIARREMSIVEFHRIERLWYGGWRGRLKLYLYDRRPVTITFTRQQFDQFKAVMIALMNT